jgi:hypothetical protein
MHIYKSMLIGGQCYQCAYILFAKNTDWIVSRKPYVKIQWFKILHSKTMYMTKLTLLPDVCKSKRWCTALTKVEQYSVILQKLLVLNHF